MALRVEGDLWVARYALPDTMDGAVFLGSIQMAIVRNPKAKAAFMSIMRDAVSKIIKAGTGVAPSWPEPEGVPAPQHERAGRA